MTDIPDKIYLSENELSTQYCSLRADMKGKPPMLNPVTHEVMKPIFCKELIRQELDDSTPYFDISEEVQAYYRTCRPSPLSQSVSTGKASRHTGKDLLQV